MLTQPGALQNLKVVACQLTSLHRQQTRAMAMASATPVRIQAIQVARGQEPDGKDQRRISERGASNLNGDLLPSQGVEDGCRVDMDGLVSFGTGHP